MFEHSFYLWQDGYKPSEWLPLLQATVAGARMPEENEATISLQLLATAAEAGEDYIASHVPAITAAVQIEICKHIPPHPEPWPQVRSMHSQYTFFIIKCDSSIISRSTPVLFARDALILQKDER